MFLTGGVSTDLHVVYVRAVGVGTELEVEVKCVRAGRRMGQLWVELKEKGTGKVVAYATHSKLNIDVVGRKEQAKL